jgi:DNA-binding PadR family transcriptional regulator
MHRIHHHCGGHKAGRGFRRFGQGIDAGIGGRPFGAGRKLGSADLQLLILGLLSEKPRHGYEIIKAFDERSNGFYIPSPGMVYPALTYLEEIGDADVKADGSRKLYHITNAGKQRLEENRGAAEAMFAQFGRIGERMERVRRAMQAEETGDSPDVENGRRGSRELLRARRDLKAALAGKWGSPREEQQRIVEILKRAAAEILGQ